jgi:hypothetical protein
LCHVVHRKNSFPIFCDISSQKWCSELLANEWTMMFPLHGLGFISGSQWLIHVSSPVVTLERNVARFASESPKFCSENWTLCYLWNGISILGTERKLPFSNPRWLCSMAKPQDPNTLLSWALIDTFKHVSCMAMF